MKKILALGVAAAIGLGSVAVATTTASADPGQNWNQDWKWKKGNKGPRGNWNKNWHGHNKWNNNWRYNRGHNYGGALLPFIVGGAIGYGLGQSYAPPAYAYDRAPSYGYSEAHIQWCLANYPNTYNPATNRYYSRPGVQAVCYSPYYG